MMRSWLLLVAVWLAAPLMAAAQAPAPTSPGAGPVIVLETEKGFVEFETYPNDAPKTVAHILGLVQKRFYTGLRFHRVIPDFVIQIGDPTTRDFTKRDDWGKYESGSPVGVAELSKARTHVAGTVSMAHLGDARKVDSQFFICLSPQAQLDGRYPIIGRVIAGMDVVRKIAEADRLIRATVREAK
jgi:cyclophilin family peptidyl-prolyl cis-trans isomerase